MIDFLYLALVSSGKYDPRENIAVATIVKAESEEHAIQIGRNLLGKENLSVFQDNAQLLGDSREMFCVVIDD